MRYSGYQNILSKLRCDYGSFDKDLKKFLIVIIGGALHLFCQKIFSESY